MEKAFELNDGTIIYSKDVKSLIINSVEEEYNHKKVLDAAVTAKKVVSKLLKSCHEK